jgi:hypothetical protein
MLQAMRDVGKGFHSIGALRQESDGAFTVTEHHEQGGPFCSTREWLWARLQGLAVRMRSESRLAPVAGLTDRVEKIVARFEKGSLLLEASSEELCFFHGDFSLRNMLLHEGQLALLDFEVSFAED